MNQHHAPVNKAAIYVFSDAACKEFGFTLFSRYFKTMREAETYAKKAGHKFFELVDFNGSKEQVKHRGGAL